MRVLLAFIDVRYAKLEQLLKRKFKVRAHYPPTVAARAMTLYFNFSVPIQHTRILKGAESVRKLPNPFRRVHKADIAGVSVEDYTSAQSRRLQ